MKNKTREFLKKLDSPACVVIGLNTLCGLSTVRSLGVNNITEFGIDKYKLTLGGFSRYCISSEVVNSDLDLLLLLEEIGKLSQHKNVIFCGHDDYLLFVDKYKEQLKQYFHLFLSQKQPLERIMNKRNMVKLAKEVGLDTPLTFYSDENPLEEMRNKMHYPAIVKPAYSQGHTTKVEVVSNQEDLNMVTKNERFRDGYLLQELIAGAEDNIWMLSGYCDRNSVPLALFTGHKYRQLPACFGIATVAFSRQDKMIDDITDKAMAFLRNIAYHGCFGFEFKRDNNGKMRFIEVNYRICDWNELAVSSGVNLPYFAYCEAIGLACQKDIKQKNGILWISILDDFATCFKYYSKNKKLILFDWLKKIFQADSYAVFRLVDINPFMLKILQHLIRIMRKVKPDKNGNN
jgi:predicted ATP-grasp superfamily ATP-dependent carboligase